MAKFLAVNWRDLKNPEAGGAEVHLHEILKRMTANGHEVTLFASNFPGGDEHDSLDGVQIIRKGSWFNANVVLPHHIRKHLKANQYDLIIEDINKVPFFLPSVTNTKVSVVIPHLFGSTVYRETNFVFGTYVYLLEKLIPTIYKRCHFSAISESTKRDLMGRGIAENRISVVLCGLAQDTYRRLDGLERFADPTIVHFGRIRKYKSVDTVIKAFAVIRQQLPKARLLIVGDGPYRPNLEALAHQMGFGESVKFLGAIPTAELVETLNRAHLFLNASSKEGWGLTVVEANACGMPVIASNRPGLQDSVRHGETGFLVDYGDPEAFAKKSLELLSDDAKWQQMSDAGIKWAKSLTWERTAAEMEQVFLKEIG